MLEFKANGDSLHDLRENSAKSQGASQIYEVLDLNHLDHIPN